MLLSFIIIYFRNLTLLNLLQKIFEKEGRCEENAKLCISAFNQLFLLAICPNTVLEYKILNGLYAKDVWLFFFLQSSEFLAGKIN